MAYSDFTLNELQDNFQLTLEEEIDLFSNVEPVVISRLLQEILKENIPLALAIHTEKARSEMIVTPILIEIRKMMQHHISLFSGIEFNVDKERGLNGTCDYILTLSKQQLYISAPVITIVEAKNDNIKSGLAQCAAAMIAARLFNARKEQSIKTVCGIVTTGSIWKFLKLDEVLYIDIKEYYLEQLSKIMGIVLSILHYYPTQ